jgi:hypothetical protein
MQWLAGALSNPKWISLICFLYILSYYAITAGSLRAQRLKLERSPFRRNGTLDVITSVLWVLIAAVLLWSLVELCVEQQISLSFLILYYIFFIFLFAFSYGILEWHFPGMLTDVDASTWRAEIQYLIISIQTQTTLGYTRARPARPLTEAIACGQVIVGLFFCIVFVARAVNLVTAIQR